MELWAIVSGLASAVSWGLGDFAGGLGSRRAAAVWVVLASQAVGAAGLVVLGLAMGEARPARGYLLLGAMAGLAGGVGLLLLYLSLARGKMGVAAPLTAVATGGIPLLVGLAAQGWPGGAQLAGFALALAAIWVIARPEGGGRLRPGDVTLPLLAGVGFGLFLTLIGLVGSEAGFVWPLVAARLASIGLMGIIGVGLMKWTGGARLGGLMPLTEQAVGASAPLPALPSAPVPAAGGGESVAPRSPGPFPWIPVLVAGVADTAGNAFFVLSAQLGRLDVAAVLSALYPAMTVLLARVILGERLTRTQQVGVGLALGAVVLIAW